MSSFLSSETSCHCHPLSQSGRQEQDCSSDISQGPLWGKLELKQRFPSEIRSWLGSSRWGVAWEEHGIWGPRAWVWILSYSLGDGGQVASTLAPGLLIWEMRPALLAHGDNAHGQPVN